MDALGIDDLDRSSHRGKLWVKHDLRFADVERALMNEDVVVAPGVGTLDDVYARTDDGRYLLVVLAAKGVGRFKIVTAFPMNRRQARWFESRRGRA